MKENLTLILLSIPLCVMLWFAMHMYLKPPESPEWQLDSAADQPSSANVTAAAGPEPVRTAQEQVIASEHGASVTLLAGDTECRAQIGEGMLVRVAYRAGTAAIRSGSLTELEQIINSYHACRDRTIRIEKTEITKKAAPSLQQRRLDEVRYYLIHMRVAKSDIQLAETL